MDVRHGGKSLGCKISNCRLFLFFAFHNWSLALNVSSLRTPKTLLCLVENLICSALCYQISYNVVDYLGFEYCFKCLEQMSPNGVQASCGNLYCFRLHICWLTKIVFSWFRCKLFNLCCSFCWNAHRPVQTGRLSCGRAASKLSYPSIDTKREVKFSFKVSSPQISILLALVNQSQKEKHSSLISFFRCFWG